VHPECGCTTSILEYQAAGDIESDELFTLSTGGMLKHAKAMAPGTSAIVATETGMLHPLRQAAPDVDFIAASEAAVCRYMKKITLPKLRDTLRDLAPEVKVPAEIADRARLSIERMVAIT
jgi:quinolinate synthase